MSLGPKAEELHYKSYDEGNLRGETGWGASTAPFSRENPNNKSSPFLLFLFGPGAASAAWQQ